MHVGLQGHTAGGRYVGCVLGCGERVPGAAEAPRFSAFSQRLAYGITPENEHHLVAQRDVRQFQVGAARTLRGAGRGEGPSCSPLCTAGPRASSGSGQLATGVWY